MTPGSADAPRILILTLSFGSGHARAAAVVANELGRQAPRADVRLLDALADSRPWFRALYVWPYWWMLRYAPGLWRRLFLSRLRRRTRHTAPAWTFRHGCPRVFETISTFQPDVIVAAEVGACEMAVIARRSGLTPAPIVCLVTDHQAEPAWVHPEVTAFAVPTREVARQLCGWGASRQQITICGIPTAARFADAAADGDVRARFGLSDGRPLVLLMGGGMGPTRMDRIAAELCATGAEMHVVAVTGHDRRARRRLARVSGHGRASIHVEGWIDDIASLMRSADLLVTKPGGVTSAEAALCGVPCVLFDPIPGPEERNAAHLADQGAALLVSGAPATAAAVTALLGDAPRRAAMAARARELATPAATQDVAALTLRACRQAHDDEGRPVLILAIRNGAGHLRVAEAIAQAIEVEAPAARVSIVDVADHMTPLTRATHVTIYLWLVRYAPWLWARIDRYQKRQSQTSPAWYYRRGCRSLFDLVRGVRPRALVATEVGCCELAALVKRDLLPACPLVAVNGEYDADRAWIQPEVDAYSVATDDVADELCALGAERSRVHAWGVPISPEFELAPSPCSDREHARRRLGLDPRLPMILVGGGSEGLGRPDLIVGGLLNAGSSQIAVLTGRNRELKRRCDALARAHGPGRLRVVDWTPAIADWMRAADLFVTKPGHTFDEALSSGLPLVSLPPPPGSEWVQYRLLDTWNVGRAVRTRDELVKVVTRLMSQPDELTAMRQSARTRSRPGAAPAVARWVRAALARPQVVDAGLVS